MEKKIYRYHKLVGVLISRAWKIGPKIHENKGIISIYLQIGTGECFYK